jgi:transcriptional regulator with XRE-family HTH domain
MDSSIETLESLKFNIERLMGANHVNRAQLSRRAGYKNSNKVTTVLNGSSLPNIDFAVRIAKAFDVEVGELFRKREEVTETEFTIQPVGVVERKASNLVNAIFQSAHKKLVEMGERPTMDMVASWWQESGGRLESCDQLAPHFDLVGVPKAGQRIPSVRQVGPKSLTAQALNSHDASAMTHFMRTLNDADLDDLRKCITTVSYSGAGLITPQTRIVDMPGMDAPVKVSFLRMMLPVTDEDGQPHILNFSTLMSESALSKRSGFLQ